MIVSYHRTLSIYFYALASNKLLHLGVNKVLIHVYQSTQFFNDSIRKAIAGATVIANHQLVQKSSQFLDFVNFCPSCLPMRNERIIRLHTY